jgi:hypothetical protein
VQQLLFLQAVTWVSCKLSTSCTSTLLLLLLLEGCANGRCCSCC